MKRSYKLILAVVLSCLALGLLVPNQFVGLSAANTTAGTTADIMSDTDTRTTGSNLEVHFIDVGQGDCTLITDGNNSMLIDAGDDSKGTLVQNYLQKRGIEKLDYLVLTHPDSDHIGGAPVVITKFAVDKVFMSNYEKDNKTYQKLIQALDDKRLKYITPEVGSTYRLGEATITILAPNTDYSDPNNASIALLLQHGSNTFLFTGDAEERAEKDILNNGLSVDADVYKVGHHGSKSSTSDAFFQAVSPEYAVISCAEGNSYGHPHAQTMNTLRMNGVKVYRTDESGSIIAASDGNVIKFDVPASDSWKAGEPIGSAAKSNQGATVTSSESTTAAAVPETTDSSDTEILTYVLNTSTKKFHKPSCNTLPTTNRSDSDKSREELISEGYSACQRCNP